MNSGDYQCLQHGLQKAGKANLMPTRPKSTERPLLWWGEIKRTSGLSRPSFPLGLGTLYRIVFPERLELSKYWHNPGADVVMTMQLIRAYFDKASNRSIGGKIDSYLPTDPDLSSFSVKARMLEGSTQVNDIGEKGEGVYDEILDVGIDYFDVEEKCLVDEHALEQITNAGLIPLLEREAQEEGWWWRIRRDGGGREASMP